MKKLLSFLIGLSILLTATPVFAVTAWYNTSWGYRVAVTVDHTKVGATLTDFPVYVSLANLPAGFFTHVKSDGSDIRVTTSDGVTEVPREVVAISTGGSTGELHLKISSLSTVSDTVFYIYYGNASATEPAANATYGSQNTWNANYRAVYHLQEAVNNNASGYKDSTSNAFSGTGSNMSGAAVTGAVAGGKAASFNGSNGYIATGQVLNTTNWSITAYENLTAYDSSSAGRSIYYQGTGASDLGTEFGSITDYPSAGNHDLFARSGGSTLDNSSLITQSLSTWYHMAGTFNGASSAYYQNGVAKGTGTVSGGSQPVQNGALGAWYNYSDSTRFLSGSLDEIRITNSVLTSTWISTEYNDLSAPGTFYSVSAEESAPTTNKVFFILSLGTFILNGGTFILFP